MNKLTCLACALLLTTAPVGAADLASPVADMTRATGHPSPIVSAEPASLGADMTRATVQAGPIVSSWNPDGSDIGYGFAGVLDRFSDSGAKPWSVLTVGAQIVATDHTGINQVVFGIATEAVADFGSFSELTGVEATAFNREPDNPWRKISLWSTFKNRPDTEYSMPPIDAANMDSQALRIESQPGTGFERGVVFARISLHPSRTLVRPVAIDFAEMDEAAVEGVDIIRFPDGCSVVYLGHGTLGTRCDQ